MSEPRHEQARGSDPARTPGSDSARTRDPGRARGPAAADEPTGSAARAAGLMALLAILLSWLPIIGPFIAGAVGGREARSTGQALAIALVPAILLGLLVGWLLTAFELPVLGAVAGLGAFLVVAAQLAPLLLGAAMGASTTTRG